MKKGSMTLKMRTALLDYINNPHLPLKELAERNGVDYATFRTNIMRHKDFINEESDKIWEAKRTLAMRTAEKMMERGNWKAVEFLLRSNGINPEERIVQSDQDIHITLEMNKDDEK